MCRELWVCVGPKTFWPVSSWSTIKVQPFKVQGSTVKVLVCQPQRSRHSPQHGVAVRLRPGPHPNGDNGATTGQRGNTSATRRGARGGLVGVCPSPEPWIRNGMVRTRRSAAPPTPVEIEMAMSLRSAAASRVTVRSARVSRSVRLGATAERPLWFPGERRAAAACDRRRGAAGAVRMRPDDTTLQFGAQETRLLLTSRASWRATTASVGAASGAGWIRGGKGPWVRWRGSLGPPLTVPLPPWRADPLNLSQEAENQRW